MGTFHCDILEGGEEGPLFAVSLVPPQADQPAQVCHQARFFLLQCPSLFTSLCWVCMSEGLYVSISDDACFLSRQEQLALLGLCAKCLAAAITRSLLVVHVWLFIPVVSDHSTFARPDTFTLS